MNGQTESPSIFSKIPTVWEALCLAAGGADTNDVRAMECGQRQQSKKAKPNTIQINEAADMYTGMGIVRAMPGPVLPLLHSPGAWR